ncbi:hypothetical protein BC832DRAFT_217003 [Gaertneriomyces semiglobifer]|nr:hypothetical protein BC832DRAFT_217003 [Gaertneriomyces semiglobifer]
MQIVSAQFHGSVPVAFDDGEEDDSDDSSYRPSEDEDEDTSVDSSNEGEDDNAGGDAMDEDVEASNNIAFNSFPNAHATPIPSAAHADHSPGSEGESDYCPSDDEPLDVIATMPHPKNKKPWTHRLTKNVCAFRERFQLDFPYWTARLFRWSQEDRKWKEKGPVILYQSPHEMAALRGNFLFGMCQAWLNLQIPEHFTHPRFFQYDQTSCIFTTGGHNTVLNSTWTCATIALYQALAMPNVPSDSPLRQLGLTWFNHQLVSQREAGASVFKLKFIDPCKLRSPDQICASFVQHISKLVSEDLRNHYLKARLRTFELSPHFCRALDFAQALAENGFMFNADNASNEVLCTFCGATFTPTRVMTGDEILNVHRNTERAKWYRCVFSFQPGELVHRDGSNTRDEDMRRLRMGPW